MQKRFKGGGILLMRGSYTYSHMTRRCGRAESLAGSEPLQRRRRRSGRFKDNTNIKGGEYSLSSFNAIPNRLILNYVLDLPFGNGRHFLASAHGLSERLIGGWSLNGITTFQTGFPLALMDASPNLLETDFAIGNGGPWTTRSGREPAELHRRLRQELPDYNVAGASGGVVQHVVASHSREPSRSAMSRASIPPCGPKAWRISMSVSRRRRPSPKKCRWRFEPRPTTFSTGCSSAHPIHSRDRPLFGQVTAQYNSPCACCSSHSV